MRKPVPPVSACTNKITRTYEPIFRKHNLKHHDVRRTSFAVKGIIKYFVELNPCASLPCLNGGTCVNNESCFTCLCTMGFTGRLCEFREFILILGILNSFPTFLSVNCVYLSPLYYSLLLNNAKPECYTGASLVA